MALRTFYTKDDSDSNISVDVYHTTEDLVDCCGDNPQDYGIIYEYRLVAVHERSGWTRKEIK